MNSFNRLLSLYIDLFLIEKILFDYNRKKRSKFYVLKKNAYICINQKKEQYERINKMM